MGNWYTSGISEIIKRLFCNHPRSSSSSGIICRTVKYPRFIYSLFLFAGALLSFVVLEPNMRQLVAHLCPAVAGDDVCDNFVGYAAVYRICFALSVFFLIFAVAMVNVNTTSDFRYKVHNGYWFLKLVLLVCLLVAAAHIPRHNQFGQVLMYVGLTTGFMFILIQILLTIDFAHSWSYSWAEKVDSGHSSAWYFMLAATTITLYSLSLTMAIFFYLYFTKLPDLGKCRGNLFLVSFNSAQCLLASLVSILPRVQDENSGSGLLQSSVVSLYTMYLTWCTLSSEPDGACNPLGDVMLDYDKASGVNGQALFECVMMFALLLFACTVRARTSNLEKIGFSLSMNLAAHNYNLWKESEKMAMKNRETNDGEKNVGDKYGGRETGDEMSENGRDKNVDDVDNEEDDKLVVYNYSYFHFVMFLASLQLMMVVTNWHSPDELSDMKRLVKNWATVWIQLSSSILCVLIYIWAIVTPLLVKTWGPCLGLDYEAVPTIDDYDYETYRTHYGESRREDEDFRRHDEEFRTRENAPNDMKNLRVANLTSKNEKSVSDSGVYDSMSMSRTATRDIPSRLRLTTEDVGSSRTMAEHTEHDEYKQTAAIVDTSCKYSEDHVSLDKASSPRLTQSAEVESGLSTSYDFCEINESFEGEHCSGTGGDDSTLTQVTIEPISSPVLQGIAGNEQGYMTVNDDVDANRTIPEHSRPDSARSVTAPRHSESHESLRNSSSILAGNDRKNTPEETGGSDASRTERVATVSRDARGSYLRMRDHIAWMKRVRRKQSESLVPTFIQTEPISALEGQNIGEKMPEATEELEILENTDILHGKLSNFEHNSPRATQMAQKRAKTHDDSAIFQHPFVHAHGARPLVNAPQAHDVAKEILRLQGKILKFQAKVVKSQQRILEVQSSPAPADHLTSGERETANLDNSGNMDEKEQEPEVVVSSGRDRENEQKVVGFQKKILKIQEKIAKLQYKVSVLQNV